MFLARQPNTAVSALSLMVGAFSIIFYSTTDSQAQTAAARCEDAAELAVLPSPLAPWKGAPLRVLFAAEKPIEGELSLIAPDGSVAATSHERLGGPPYFWIAEVATPGRRKLAGEAHPPERAGRVRHHHPRDRRARRKAGGPAHRRRQRLAAAQPVEPRDTKISIRRGSRSCSTRRSTLRCRGRRCTRACAISRATSCSIIWVSTKTR